MNSIAHFLVTRFNVRETSTDRRALDIEWLSARFELFERFCFPTVRAQTDQNFRWLVLFDAETPAPIRTRIEGCARWPNLTPVFIPPGVEGAARKAVEGHLRGIPDVLLTTRLDNDDGICRTFVQEIHQHANVSVPTVLDFPVGYVWYRGRIYRYHLPLNAFTTLAEPRRSLKGSGFHTVYTGSHTQLGRVGDVVAVNSRPSWLQVVHGGNLENRPRGIRQSLSLLRQDFDIDPTLMQGPENAIALQLDKAYTAARTGASHCYRAALERLSRWRAGVRLGDL